MLDDWQAYVLDVALGERVDGRWAAFEVGLVVSRQNGKGSVLEARELAGLFLFDERLILHSAHEFKTAWEAFLRIKTLIENTPDLEKKVRSVRQSHADVCIELKNGARLRFVARSRGSGRGFSGDCVILDEAYNLEAQAMAALLPTLSARPNPQLWYASSAPMTTSTQLRAVRKRAAHGAGGRLAYLEWSIEPGADVASVESWAVANPALGIRIPVEFVENEMAAMSDNLAEFARERLGVPDAEDGAGGEIPLDVWADLTEDDSKIADGRVFALDVNPERSWASIGVAGARADGLVHVEVVDRRQGTGWVVDRAAELCAKWSASLVVDRSSPAGALLSDLEVARVPVVEVSQREHAQACGALVDGVRNRQLRHLGQASLFSAITGAQKRQSGDVWLWSRVASHVDITPLVAVTLALGSVGLGAPSVYEERGALVL